MPTPAKAVRLITVWSRTRGTHCRGCLESNVESRWTPVRQTVVPASRSQLCNGRFQALVYPPHLQREGVNGAIARFIAGLDALRATAPTVTLT